ncbi:MAG TPA: translation initiation factor [Bacteroidia bacterium]|jgi:translation initiation factor 1|nr:translation initiation factor [Bacteroidia bacterium]HMU18663.1 translation initiation factor [Bacteroidia bacterium]
MSKKKNESSGIVYSTNPDFKFNNNSNIESVTPAPAQQDLRVMRDSKQRGGKTVTLIKGFVGKEEDIEKLTKMIKTKCGTGGTFKDGEIIIQGDQREKVFDLLLAAGYKVKKAGG